MITRKSFTMRAMVLEKIGAPLVLKEVPIPEPGPFELRIRISACGVCRTDLHIIEGDLVPPQLPLILGHQIVGRIDKLGEKANRYQLEERVGVPWLGKSCQSCSFCHENRENLCNTPIFTGFSNNGGFAEYVVAHQDFLFPLPNSYNDLHAAPLLCAGLIGYRAFRLVGEGHNLGLYGFGSAAHLLIQLATQLKRNVYVFTRPGDLETQDFARSLGAVWAGDSDMPSPVPLDGALLFAPVGALYIEALKSLKKGGRVVSAGIHMSDIPTFPYHLLWEERSLSSVANLTREDGREYFTLAEQYPLQPQVHSFPLAQANEALMAIKKGQTGGSVVLRIR